jgi:hypothetical protein
LFNVSGPSCRIVGVGDPLLGTVLGVPFEPAGAGGEEVPGLALAVTVIVGAGLEFCAVLVP